jgi:hypothetical protein
LKGTSSASTGNGKILPQRHISVKLAERKIEAKSIAEGVAACAFSRTAAKVRQVGSLLDSAGILLSALIA